ncbi:hypothetical protein FQA39_LY04083 [Lamprigera yunnana]|nr:hypothetical protein FQA39_LY04082 [Lamprigera yunnana]KAF5287909.1 hypothetical protein FQA39_LY04083 [Lamprigera yunnana]
MATSKAVIAKKEQHLNILIVKKEQYFTCIQNLYECSLDLSSKEKFSKFYEINIASYELKSNFVERSTELETFDELCCYIESVAEEVIEKDKKGVFKNDPSPLSSRMFYQFNT